VNTVPPPRDPPLDVIVAGDTVTATEAGVPVAVPLYSPAVKFTAATRTVYEVPLVSPVSVYEVLLLPVSTYAAEPPDGVYSTR
jgi:hypothetical protein